MLDNVERYLSSVFVRFCSREKRVRDTAERNRVHPDKTLKDSSFLLTGVRINEVVIKVCTD